MKYFQQDTSEFQSELRRRVFSYFKDNKIHPFADNLMLIKGLSLLVMWAVSLLLIYLFAHNLAGAIALYLLHGLISLFVVFNVGHDAVHRAIFSKQKWNKIFSYSFNLMGVNQYSWYLKHNIGHHRFTNIHDKDLDIETVPLFRVSPHTRHRWYYRFQHIYILPLYGILSLILVFIVDFAVMFRIKPENIKRSLFREWIILLVTKLFYISYIIILPIYILPLSVEEVLLSFLAMHFLVGLIISLVLLPSHFNEHAQFYMQEEMSGAGTSWARHQLATTIDIAAQSKLMNFLVGGLNTNTIHHIYASVAHAHLITLSKILEETAQKFDVTYVNLSLSEAMKSHFRFLYRMGRKEF